MHRTLGWARLRAPGVLAAAALVVTVAACAEGGRPSGPPGAGLPFPQGVSVSVGVDGGGSFYSFTSSLDPDLALAAYSTTLEAAGFADGGTARGWEQFSDGHRTVAGPDGVYLIGHRARRGGGPDRGRRGDRQADRRADGRRDQPGDGVPGRRRLGGRRESRGHGCPTGGHDLRARIEADGTVTWNGERFVSLSTAAGMARKSVVGAPPGRDYPQTNGWTFWRFRGEDGEDGEEHLLDSLRQQLHTSTGAR